MQNTDERLAHSRTEAAVLIGVSLFTIEKLINAGELRCKRVGRRVLIPRTELERLLAPPELEAA